jgi:hypothetical protein
MKSLTATVGVIFMVFGLFGCSKEPEGQLVTVKGQAYFIPRQDQPRLDRERLAPHYVYVYPKLKSTQLKIRIWYQSEEYDMLSRLNIPDIFGVVGDDEKKVQEQLREFVVGNVTVLCHKRGYGLGLHYTCGFRVMDKNVSWSVNFDEEFIDQAPLIKAEAAQKLKSYRDSANGNYGDSELRWNYGDKLR